MEQYLDHSVKVLSDISSGYKPNRTGIDTISRFGHQNEYELSEGFPLLTTKRTAIKSVVHELIWFLRGDTNIKYLVDNNVTIWDGNAFQRYNMGPHGNRLIIYSPEWKRAKEDYIARIKEDDEFSHEHGDLGPVYGSQWRRWVSFDGKEIDQIADAIELIRKDSHSRRIIVSSWNSREIGDMELPPCHSLFQINTLDGKLDIELYQRSADMFLGVPFNLASYALLIQILAQETGFVPGRFIHTFGDAHFYCGTDERGEFYRENLSELKKRVLLVSKGGRKEEYLDILSWILERAPSERPGKEGQDHVTAILEQLSREPRSLPSMEIAKKPFDELVFEDFNLLGYTSHPSIKRAMAV
jgi:thymidylate synthase